MKRKVLGIPYVVWMALFVVVPLILVVIFAFTARGGGFTLQNFTDMTDYVSAFGRSFLLAFAATAICILIGYPVAYLLTREGNGLRRIAMMLIILPMWMNFLLRTYSWVFLLERNGLINRILKAIGLPIQTILGSPAAVTLGMVYNFLPFMILPVFSVIDKIDPKVIEAAQDLGADGVMVFRKIIFPLSLPGVLSGITMVFIPSVSTFVIPRLLGGSKTLYLGDLIETQFLGGAYNPYLGSAISLVMMVLVLISMAIMNRFGEGEEGAVLL